VDVQDNTKTRGDAHDPVCGMTVKEQNASHTLDHKGEQYFFCSSKCKSKFKVSPERYLNDEPVEDDVPEGTIYTSPMHPEIVQVGPGMAIFPHHEVEYVQPHRNGGFCGVGF